MIYLEELEPRILLAAGPTTLSIAPITWNVIGLDSNKATAGPNSYLIGVRVTNTGAADATGVLVHFVFDEAGPSPINLSSKDTRTLATLAPGASHDFYFNVDIDRASTSYNKTRDYHISAIADNAFEVDTPLGRELYVEHLVSQNRNATVSITAPSTVLLGSVFKIVHVAKTSTNGYEQLVSELTLPSDVFEILSTSVTYTAPPGLTGDQLYVDAATWDNDPASPTYRSALGTGKAGGDVVTTYIVRIVDDPASVGSYSVTANIYDFSGSSYHYNSDYGTLSFTISVISTTPPAIGDTVFEDLNANGVQDSGEPGIGGVSVSLHRASDGATLKTIVTPASGFFLFDQTNVAGGFPAGDYYLTFTAPAGYTYTGLHVGGSKSVDSDADPALDGDGNPLTAQTAVFSIAAGETNLDIDAGLYRTASVTGFVFSDLNADGVQGGGSESGVSGVTVKLYDATGKFVASTVTLAGGSKGMYSFTGLTPGTYSVEVILPAASGFSPKDATVDTLDSDVNPANGKSDLVTVVSGGSTAVDAGLVTGKRLGDFVWLDLNANGIQDPGEAGVDGVKVELLDTTNTVLASTVTAGGGFFSILAPASGTYALRYTAPAGFTFTVPLAGADPAFDSNVDTTLADGDSDAQTARTAYVSISSLDYSLDCGLVGIGKIGDFVWDDVNGNGVPDGGSETGIDGVTVRLYQDKVDSILNGNETLIRTVVTSGGGAFLFSDLAPGTYWVEVDETTVAPGAALTTGGNPFGPVTLDTTSLPGSMSFLGADFGYSRPAVKATMTSSVLTDADGSGGPSAGDTLRYTVTITNTGGKDALSIVFSDLISDPNLSLVIGSVTTSQGTVTSGNGAGDTSIGVSVGTISAVGGTVTITFDVVIANPVSPAGTTTVSTQGSVSGSNIITTTTDDPGTGASGDPTVTTLPGGGGGGQPDLTLTDSDGVTTATPGATLSYVLGFSNTGTADATGVMITEILPANTTFDPAASTPGWTEISPGVFTFAVGSLGAGASGSVTFAVTVASSLPAGTTTITNSASIGDDGTHGADLTPADNSAGDTDSTSAKPDYAITISDGVTTAAPGDTLTYTVTVTNAGGIGGTGVTAVVAFDPALLTGVTATGGGVVDPVAGTITWSLGALAGGGASIAVTFTATVVNPAPAGATTVDNGASVSDDGANGPDANPADNTATDSDVLGAAPDYSIVVSDGVGTVTPGDNLTYTVTVTNSGSQGGTGVTAVVTFDPALLTGVTAQNGGVVDPVAGTITWSLGSLAGGGASTVVTFTATVVSPAPAGANTIDTDGTVGDDGANGADANPADNSDRDSDTLDAAPGYRLAKSDGIDGIRAGQTVTYTLQVDNVGNQDGTGVVLTDTLPGFFTVVSVSNGGVYDPATGTVTWNLGGLAAGSSQVVTVTGTFASRIPVGVDFLTNTASVTDDGANGADPTPGDNAATDTDAVEVRRMSEVPDNLFARGHRLLGTAPFRHRLTPLPDLAPLYSGTADPDSILELALQNSRGEIIGWQTVQVDAGGNWFAVFSVDSLVEYRDLGADFLPPDPRAPQPSQDGNVFDDSRLFVDVPGAERRVGNSLTDAPHEIAIVQRRSAVDPTAAAGLNLRVYFAPAFNGGLYDLPFAGADGVQNPSGFDVLARANANPLRAGFVSFAGEFLCESWVPSGR